MKKLFNVRSLVHSAFIAALYLALTVLANMLGLANGVIQLRFSEALCVLPAFTPAAIWGLFIGCILSNFLTGAILPDIILGSLATLIGAVGTRLIRHHNRIITIPPIIANILIIPPVLAYIYKFEGSVFYFMITVGIGEILSCGVLGSLFYKLLSKYKSILFPE